MNSTARQTGIVITGPARLERAEIAIQESRDGNASAGFEVKAVKEKREKTRQESLVENLHSGHGFRFTGLPLAYVLHSTFVADKQRCTTTQQCGACPYRFASFTARACLREFPKTYQIMSHKSNKAHRVTLMYI